MGLKHKRLKWRHMPCHKKANKQVFEDRMLKANYFGKFAKNILAGRMWHAKCLFETLALDRHLI